MYENACLGLRNNAWAVFLERWNYDVLVWWIGIAVPKEIDSIYAALTAHQPLFKRWIENYTPIPKLGKLRRAMEPNFQILILLSLWVDVVAFVDIRAVVNRVAGESYSENEWGFGQIIAVTAWLPMVGQFFKAWKFVMYLGPAQAQKIPSSSLLMAGVFASTSIGLVTGGMLGLERSHPSDNRKAPGLNLYAVNEAVNIDQAPHHPYSTPSDHS